MSYRYLEKLITRSCIADLLAAGFSVTVNDGEENVLVRSQDAQAIQSVMCSTNEDVLFVHQPGASRVFGWIRFIYGNDGWDVINDYTVNLGQTLEKTNNLVQSLCV